MLTCASIDSAHLHHAGCRCAETRLSRRSAMKLGLGAVLTGASLGLASRAMAASGHYDAMLLNCIDPRFVTNSVAFMQDGKLQGKYSHFVLAGGPIGVVAPKFSSWHQTFWDNLGASIQLHNIHTIISLTHRDCGAAKIAYGEAAVADQNAETSTHIKALQEFRAQASKRQPKLKVVTGIMALDGSVMMVG